MSDLFSFAKQNDATKLREAFSKGIGVKACDDHGRTLLHHAGAGNAEEVIDLLIGKGASIEATDKEGYTPLTWAIKSKSEDGAIALIERGANVDVRMPNGNSILLFVDSSTFTARVTAAKQAASARKMSSLTGLFGAIGAASEPSAVSPLPQSPTTQSTSNLPSPPTPKPSESTSLPTLASPAGTIRRSSISVKSTAEKQLLMSDSASPTSSTSPSNKKRPVGVTYATVRPRSMTVNHSKLAESGIPNWTPPPRRSILAPSTYDNNVAASTSSSSSSSPSSSTPSVPGASKSDVVVNVSNGESSSSKSSTEKPETNEKKGTLSKDKEKSKEKSKDKEKAKQEKKDKKEKEKQAKKEIKEKKKADAEAAAAAKAEKDSKRRTISIFSKPSKGSSEQSTPKTTGPNTSRRKLDASSATSTSTTTSITSSSTSTNATATTTPAAAGPAPTSINLALPLSSSTQRPPVSPSTPGTPMTPSHQVMPHSDEKVAVVDNVPAGAVALPNGDFLVGVEATDINLDALTEAMAQFLREVGTPEFGTMSFTFRPLLEATKILSTTMKKMFSVADIYALTLPPETSRSFSEVVDTLKSDVIKGLFDSIKALNQDATNTTHMKQTCKQLSQQIHLLYKCLESVPSESIVECLQSVVLSLRQITSAVKSENDEAYQSITSQAVMSSMRLSSLIQDYSFASTSNMRTQRALFEGTFSLAQSVRGLVQLGAKVRAEPAVEQHYNSLVAMLRNAAESVRSVSRCIRDDENSATTPRDDASLIPAPVNQVIEMLNKGTGFMVNAKDKYITRTSNSTLDKDEKQLLQTINTQAQYISELESICFVTKNGNIMDTAVKIGASIGSIHSIVQPSLDICHNQLIIDEATACLENVIRCGIQIKIVCSMLHCFPNNMELKLHLAFICQLWGIYSTFLLDAVWRANRL